MNTLIWYTENIFRHMLQMLPCMTIALLFWSVIRPWRLKYIEKHGLYSTKRREIVLLGYVMFCAGLGALTLFPYGFWEEYLRVFVDPGHHPSVQFPSFADSLVLLRQLPQSITPFREILRVNHGGPWLWFVLWGNIGMFAPIGFGLPLLWRNKQWYHALLLGGIISFLIELIQIFVGRVSDIDDVILNSIGAFFGFCLYFICSKVIPLNWDNFHCKKEEAV